MAFRTWARILLAAFGVGALAGASQLGVAYGLGVVRLTRIFDVTARDQWTAQLAWACWFAMVAGVIGALAGGRLVTRWGRPSPGAARTSDDPPSGDPGTAGAGPTGSDTTGSGTTGSGTTGSGTTGSDTTAFGAGGHPPVSDRPVGDPPVGVDAATQIESETAPGREARWGSAIMTALAAGLGAAIVVPLTMQPARTAQVADVDPVFVIAVCAVLGTVIGVCAGVAVLMHTVARRSVTVVVAAIWAIAIISVVPSLGLERLPAVRLGVFDAGFLSPATTQRSALFTMPALALSAGAALGWLARREGRPPVTVALAGLPGPLLLTLVYLISGPGNGAERYQLVPYWAATAATLAGILGSVLAAVLRRNRSADQLPDGEPAAVEPTLAPVADRPPLPRRRTGSAEQMVPPPPPGGFPPSAPAPASDAGLGPAVPERPRTDQAAFGAWTRPADPGRDQPAYGTQPRPDHAGPGGTAHGAQTGGAGWGQPPAGQPDTGRSSYAAAGPQPPVVEPPGYLKAAIPPSAHRSEPQSDGSPADQRSFFDARSAPVEPHERERNARAAETRVGEAAPRAAETRRDGARHGARPAAKPDSPIEAEQSTAVPPVPRPATSPYIATPIADPPPPVRSAGGVLGRLQKLGFGRDADRSDEPGTQTDPEPPAGGPPYPADAPRYPAPAGPREPSSPIPEPPRATAATSRTRPTRVGSPTPQLQPVSAPLPQPTPVAPSAAPPPFASTVGQPVNPSSPADPPEEAPTGRRASRQTPLRPQDEEYVDWVSGLGGD